MYAITTGHDVCFLVLFSYCIYVHSKLLSLLVLHVCLGSFNKQFWIVLCALDLEIVEMRALGGGGGGGGGG